MESRSTLPLAGGVGELLIRGPQVVAGYWKKAEESVAAFEDGWLRTGDLARTDKEGWFYVVDRMKDMIVASGFKVWPREVEDVLHEHPTVSEAAVIGVPDSYRGESPKASWWQGKVEKFLQRTSSRSVVSDWHHTRYRAQ
ncbi:hypothetical protein AWV79_11945 [Cupriavidus sp. UYMMa02A]|nr:hypothetical protein AWV79_26775 [Cupriavidus sp. UYMMa02A]ODV44037.1 hypothetical protein AWV79_11945 [Cupriavidus sp. UYMMa02A]